MSLFGKKEKEEIARLNAEMQSLRDAMPSESRTLDDINREIKDSREELARVQENLESRNSELKDALEELQQAKDQLIETNEEVLMQSFGLYTPRYSFMNADEYKAHLLEIRAKQKDMIKNKTAVSGNMNWTVNGNASKGKKMVSDMQKLLLRAFNSECDDVIEHVKYNNIEVSEKRITASREAISKLVTIMEVSIQPQYYRLKIEELHLAFENAQKNLLANSPYEGMIGKVEHLYDQISTGATSEDLARLFFKAATDRRPKRRYYNSPIDHGIVLVARTMPNTYRTVMNKMMKG